MRVVSFGLQPFTPSSCRLTHDANLADASAAYTWVVRAVAGERLSGSFENRIETADMGVTMKKLFLATTAMVALAYGSATAADLPTKARPLPPPPPPCAQFGGFYFGGNVGYGYGDHTFRSLDTFGPTGEFGPHEVSRSVDGWAAGIQGGYNWQSRCTLFGIEADYQWTDIDHDFVRTGPFGLATLSGSLSLQSFGTVRARTGVIVDNLLLYVTGGFAYANTERTVNLNIPALGISESFSDEKTRWGWTMGFGTEWQFAPNWSFKSEVLYARFETEEATRTCTLLCGGVPTSLRFEHDSSAWVTRIGINYKFGGWGGSGSGY
jgi:outer membrane immunogenic protein